MRKELVASEDAQPNEIRAGRKGVAAVPTVRISRPPNKSTSRRGAFQAQKGPPHEHGHWHSAPQPGRALHTSTSVSHDEKLRYNDTTTFAVSQAPPSSSTKRLPLVDSSSLSPRGRKRPRLQNPWPSSASSPSGARCTRKKGKVAQSVLRQVQEFDLPPECCKGAPGSNKARSAWVVEIKKGLLTHSGLEAQNIELFDNKIRFHCRPLPPSHIETDARRAILAAEYDGSSSIPNALHPNHSAEKSDKPEYWEAIVSASVFAHGTPCLSSTLYEPPSNDSSDTKSTRRANLDIIGQPTMAVTSLQAIARTQFEPRTHVFRATTPVGSPPPKSKMFGEIGTPTAGFERPQTAVAHEFRLDHDLSRASQAPKHSHLSLTSTSSSSFFSSSAAPVSRGFRSGEMFVSAPDKNPRDTGASPMPILPEGEMSALASRVTPPIRRRVERSPTCHTKSRARIVDDSRPDLLRAPRETYDRPRCLLPCNSTGSWISVSMHGFVDELSLTRSLKLLRSPVLPAKEMVDDSCLLAHAKILVLGHARKEGALSLMSVLDSGLGACTVLERPSPATLKSGVSALCAMSDPRMFASAGHDHVVDLWSMNLEDLSLSQRQTLHIKHTSVVHSLLPYRDSSHKLVSAGADCLVNIYDMSSERVVTTVKASSAVYRVHKPPMDNYLLLETAHRDSQFELRDSRLVNSRPLQRFGYETDQFHGRYIKGSLFSHIFSCGGRDGSVRLWDLRQPNQILQTLPCFPGRKALLVEHVANKCVACSDDHEFWMASSATGTE